MGKKCKALCIPTEMKADTRDSHALVPALPSGRRSSSLIWAVQGPVKAWPFTSCSVLLPLSPGPRFWELFCRRSQERVSDLFQSNRKVALEENQEDGRSKVKGCG